MRHFLVLWNMLAEGCIRVIFCALWNMLAEGCRGGIHDAKQPAKLLASAHSLRCADLNAHLYGLPTLSVSLGQHIFVQAGGDAGNFFTARLYYDVVTFTH
jgi:hypothetical protein